MDPLERRATMTRLWTLFKMGILPSSAWEPAQEAAGFIPQKADWQRFLDRILLGAGTAFLISGIFFFFAFNWADLPRVVQFGLLQFSVVLTATLAFFYRLETWAGRAFLITAMMLIGTTLAVVGQAYQTGADAYNLFVIWLLLISGWVLISGWNVPWLIALILANVILVTYWVQVVGFREEFMLTRILVALNLIFYIGWDGLRQILRLSFLEWRWHLYLPALAVIGLISAWMLILTWGWMREIPNDLALWYIGILGLHMGYYFWQKALPMVALGSLSLLVVSISAIGKVLWEVMVSDTSQETFEGFIFFFVMGIITVLLTGAIAYLLRMLDRRWGEEVGV